MDWQEISIDDIRLNRPDLYQEIVEDVLMSAFAGKADEVYGIVLPAINEMQAEIKTVTDQLRAEINIVTDQLRHDLESIVGKEARRKFKKILSDIEKATTYKSDWRETEKQGIHIEILREIEERQQGQQQEISSHINQKRENDSGRKNHSKPVITPKYRQPSAPNLQPSAKVGDEIFYHGHTYKVISKKVSGETQRLLLYNEYGRVSSILDNPSTYTIITIE